MRKIEVKPGYYEWNAYADGEQFYSFDAETLSEDALTYSAEDGTDIGDIDEITYEGLKNVAELYVDAMQGEIQERDCWNNDDDDENEDNDNELIDIDLTPEELTELRKQLVTEWARYFGVSEEKEEKEENIMKGLYKGKRVDNGEWIKGYLLVDELTGQYFIHASGNSVNESPKVGEEGVLHFLAFEVIPETVGEYTRQNDKNGALIFEGDIIKTKFFGKQVGDVILGNVVADYDKFVVTFGISTFYLENKIRRFPLAYIKEPGANFEVVGNIHDNPDNTIKSEF